MLFVDIIKEYFLICKLRLAPILYKNKPAHWSLGDKGNIILVPGLHETYHFLYKIADHLNALGYKIHLIENFDPNEKVELLAKKLEKEILNVNMDNIILLSHSKGGLTAKYFLDKSICSEKVKLSISIAIPYGGSIFGYLPFHSMGELSPSSTLITQLSKDKNNLAKIYNFYPKFDNHIIPNKNLILDGAKNIVIDINGHTRILESELLLKEIVEILSN